MRPFVIAPERQVPDGLQTIGVRKARMVERVRRSVTGIRRTNESGTATAQPVVSSGDGRLFVLPAATRMNHINKAMNGSSRIRDFVQRAAGAGHIAEFGDWLARCDAVEGRNRTRPGAAGRKAGAACTPGLTSAGLAPDIGLTRLYSPVPFSKRARPAATTGRHCG
ncbi:hypothetical protein ACFFNY_05750 [Paenibacillus hodogayensis]|uniref:Uncharacterized protein n=1 Tax=Paenibacillus hodogayensis TaxID=279208 RepID=A0ABV5VSU7_9BACL